MPKRTATFRTHGSYVHEKLHCVFGLHLTVGGFCFVLLCFFVLFVSLFFLYFGNADLFCLILQLGRCCHSNVCGIPHCVPEVHGKFYARPHQDKSYPMDGRVSSRTCNLFWLPGDSDSDTLQFCNNYQISQRTFNSTLHIHTVLDLSFILVTGCSDKYIIFLFFDLLLLMFSGLVPQSSP